MELDSVRSLQQTDNPRSCRVVERLCITMIREVIVAANARRGAVTAALYQIDRDDRLSHRAALRTSPDHRTAGTSFDCRPLQLIPPRLAPQSSTHADSTAGTTHLSTPVPETERKEQLLVATHRRAGVGCHRRTASARAFGCARRPSLCCWGSGCTKPLAGPVPFRRSL